MMNDSWIQRLMHEDREFRSYLFATFIAYFTHSSHDDIRFPVTKGLLDERGNHE